METIRNYLNTMFSHLPDTPEVIRAKNELWQMMEDKYTELKQEGRSENEAIGTVISEFGNLDELSDILGIRNYLEPVAHVENTAPLGGRDDANEAETDGTSSEAQEAPPQPARRLTLEEVRDFLRDRERQAWSLGLGIFFCIICPTGSILFVDTRLEWLGNSLLFVFVAIGVILIVFSCLQFDQRWDFLIHKKVRCSLDSDCTRYVADCRQLRRAAYARQLSFGIAFCILSVVPPIICDNLNIYNDWIVNLGATFLFFFVGVGVLLIVSAGMTNGAYAALLKCGDTDAPNRTFAQPPEPETQYVSPLAAAVLSVYWQTVICLYLIWSFLSFDWGITWIIWPIAAIVYSVLKSVWKK